jgi:hypothetical protein
MPPFPESTVPARNPRAIDACEGYVHKLRLESREVAAAESWARPSATPSVSLGSLLGKLALYVVALTGIAAAGGTVLLSS